MQTQLAPLYKWWNTTLVAFNNLPVSTQWWVLFGSWACAGFIGGLLIKYCLRHFIMVLLLTTSILALLHYTHLITIHYQSLYTLLGVSSYATIADFGQMLVKWSYDHKAFCGAGLFGCYIAKIIS